MSASRMLRPFARALQRQAFAAPAPVRTAAKVAPFTPSYNGKQLSFGQKADAQMAVVYAGMPQLVPFFWVNEATYAFIALPTLIYLFSKYLLPQDVRRMCARLFISKL
ncbi:uncharacterized protein K452DRAFT_231955 [Aplosporella prunicola CBS 121167]|uniref:ATP synthase protein 8 n=1 Tax=Aplosporella prunicola CBS 121167 TaxID=1176127 RepID=A0A6A6BB98_9PEZI|nr:uncharacterized protein K452DRAFT_231955 [Aplosporella prunicola CBS 121167]KAF2139751.1 hypothetical protein K452DRAFT_231955 [Aplosporella prunicola CBS 121167]